MLPGLLLSLEVQSRPQLLPVFSQDQKRQGHIERVEQGLAAAAALTYNHFRPHDPAKVIN